LADQILAGIRRQYDELNAALAQPASRPQISSPSDVHGLVAPALESLEHEELWVVLLDTRNRVKKLVRLYVGNVNTNIIRVGEIFSAAIIENAPAVIIVHNHPSGDASPSPEDVAVTRAIIEAGKLLDIDLLDHIVIGRGRYVSLKDRGLGALWNDREDSPRRGA
jgi:DNA repair protein RadC